MSPPRPPPALPFVVEVVMGTRERQVSERVEVVPGERVAQVLERCTLSAGFPELDPGELAPAVHGRRVSMREVLRPGDRLELLRPLLVDPKEARRLRARRGKKRRG